MMMLKQKLIILVVFFGILLGFAFYGASYLEDKREVSYFQSLANTRPDGQTYVDELFTARSQLKDKDKANDFAGYVSLGVNLNILGQKQEALGYYQKGLVIDPTNLLVLNNMAGIFSDLGQYDKAEAYWLKLTELYPDKTMFWRSLGYLYRYRMQKSSQEIEEFFKKGLSATNNDADLITWLISYFEETLNNEKFAEYANLLNAKLKQ
ncbi:MAG: hypothetical protein Greene071421_71 [Parcubacteria group bacterium Greene0714_21]|nr:MAG: hypothetical protein Greene071421_71 [Parcubacteria group bacterium Greene0714_21]